MVEQKYTMMMMMMMMMMTIVTDSVYLFLCFCSMCWLDFNRKASLHLGNLPPPSSPSKTYNSNIILEAIEFLFGALSQGWLRRFVSVAVHSHLHGRIPPKKKKECRPKQGGRHAWYQNPLRIHGVLLYLPTWMVDSYGKWRQIYQSHGSFLENESFDATIDFHSATMVGSEETADFFIAKNEKHSLGVGFNRFFLMFTPWEMIQLY